MTKKDLLEVMYDEMKHAESDIDSIRLYDLPKGVIYFLNQIEYAVEKLIGIYKKEVKD